MWLLNRCTRLSLVKWSSMAESMIRTKLRHKLHLRMMEKIRNKKCYVDCPATEFYSSRNKFPIQNSQLRLSVIKFQECGLRYHVCIHVFVPWLSLCGDSDTIDISKVTMYSLMLSDSFSNQFCTWSFITFNRRLNH